MKRIGIEISASCYDSLRFVTICYDFPISLRFYNFVTPSALQNKTYAFSFSEPLWFCCLAAPVAVPVFFACRFGFALRIFCLVKFACTSWSSAAMTIHFWLLICKWQHSAVYWHTFAFTRKNTSVHERASKQARKQKGEDAWLERSLAAKQLGVFVTVSNCLKVHANSFLCSTAITLWDQYAAAQEATHRWQTRVRCPRCRDSLRFVTISYYSSRFVTFLIRFIRPRFALGFSSYMKVKVGRMKRIGIEISAAWYDFVPIYDFVTIRYYSDPFHPTRDKDAQACSTACNCFSFPAVPLSVDWKNPLSCTVPDFPEGTAAEQQQHRENTARGPFAPPFSQRNMVNTTIKHVWMF